MKNTLKYSYAIVAMVALINVASLAKAEDTNSLSARQQSCRKMRARADAHPNASAKPVEHSNILSEVEPELDVSVTRQPKATSHFNYLVFLDDQRVGVLSGGGYRQDSNVFRAPGSIHPLTVRGYGEYGSVDIKIPDTDCESLAVEVPLKQHPVKLSKSDVEVTGLPNGVFTLGTANLTIKFTDTTTHKTLEFGDFTYSAIVYDKLNRPLNLSFFAGNPQGDKSQLYIQLQRAMEINTSYFTTDTKPPLRLVVHLLANDGTEYEQALPFTLKTNGPDSILTQLTTTLWGRWGRADNCLSACFLDYLDKNSKPSSSRFDLGESAAEACDKQISDIVTVELQGDTRQPVVDERRGIKIDAADLRIKQMQAVDSITNRQIHLNCALEPPH